MAWIYKRGGVWWIGYRVNGRQVLRSTKTDDESKARKELAKVETLFKVHESGNLTQELFGLLTGVVTARKTLFKSVNEWIASSKQTTAFKTYVKYEAVARELIGFTNATEKGPPLDEITPEVVRAFLTQKRKKTSASTVNGARKVLSVFFRWEMKNQTIKSNPVFAVDAFKAGPDEAGERRAFTLAELSLIYSKAPSDFWRYMVLGGFYTGLRMGDLICMQWGSVDFENRVLRVTSMKTSVRVNIPIAPRLLTAILDRRGKCDKIGPSHFLWPDEAARYLDGKNSAPFSNQFADILASCGLINPRVKNNQKSKNGRDSKRESSAASFHCMRHSFVSILKATGASQATTKELAGHNTDRISDLYTHLPEQVLQDAINRMPTIEV